MLLPDANDRERQKKKEEKLLPSLEADKTFFKKLQMAETKNS